MDLKCHRSGYCQNMAGCALCVGLNGEPGDCMKSDSSKESHSFSQTVGA